jgi:hypothetical protein
MSTLAHICSQILWSLWRSDVIYIKPGTFIQVNTKNDIKQIPFKNTSPQYIETTSARAAEFVVDHVWQRQVSTEIETKSYCKNQGPCIFNLSHLMPGRMLESQEMTAYIWLLRANFPTTPTFLTSYDAAELFDRPIENWSAKRIAQFKERFTKPHILVPHFVPGVPGHWMLFHIDQANKTITHYDSMRNFSETGNPFPKLEIWKHWLGVDAVSWKLLQPSVKWYSQISVDCGVYVLYAMHYIAMCIDQNKTLDTVAIPLLQHITKTTDPQRASREVRKRLAVALILGKLDPMNV